MFHNVHSTIKIMTWNANELLMHQQELYTILDINKIEVCLILETHFTRQSLTRFKRYKAIRPEKAAK